MALEELTAESTKEEISDYVEQVAEDVEAERAGEQEKGDARITSEHADNEHKEIPAEEKTGSKAAASKDKGEDDPGEKKSAAKWLDDDLKAEVAAYGIEESELADFASREELDRALRLFDKSAMEAGKKALAEQGDAEKAGAPPRNEKGEFVKQEKQPEKKPEKPEGKVGGYEVALSKDVYDEEIVSEFTRMRDHYESRLEALESRFAESDARAEQNHFDSLVDSLGHDDLFGKTDKEDPKQLQRRQELNTAVKAWMLGLAHLGRPANLSSEMVARVARMAFPEELAKRDIKNHTRKISRQSNGRQGGGATRPQEPREDPRDAAERLYKELERA